MGRTGIAGPCRRDLAGAINRVLVLVEHSKCGAQRTRDVDEAGVERELALHQRRWTAEVAIESQSHGYFALAIPRETV